MSSWRYKLGSITFDVGNRMLKCDGKEKRLPPIPARLLEVLALESLDKGHNHPVGRDFLLEKVWSVHRDPTVVDKTLRRLKEHLNQCNPNHEYIEAVQGGGFRITVPVELVLPEKLVIGARISDIYDSHDYTRLLVERTVYGELDKIPFEQIIVKQVIVQLITAVQYKNWRAKECDLDVYFVLTLDTWGLKKHIHVSAQLMNVHPELPSFNRSLRGTKEFVGDIFKIQHDVPRWVLATIGLKPLE